LIDPRAPERFSALQIYDRAGKQLGDGFPAHLQNGVRAAVFSPNAAFVASLDETGTTRVFATKSQRQISSAKILVPEPSDLVVTDDGMLVAASALGSLHCFRAISGETIKVVNQAHWKPIRKLALSPNGKLVATMAEDHLIKLWSLPGFEPRGGFDAPKADQYMGSVLFLDDQTLAAGGVGGIVRIWKIKDAIDLAHWNVHSSGAAADAVAISYDGARIALGDATGVLHLLDAENSRELAALPAHSGGVRQVQFVTGSHEVITKGAEGPPLRWDWERTSKSATAEGEKLSSGRHDTLSALDPGVQIAGSEGIFFDRGRASEKFLSIYGIQSSRVLAGEHWLMVAAPSGIWIIDTEKRALIWGFETPAYTYALALDTSRRELISTHDDGVVRRWKIPDKSQTLPRKEQNGN
jgi:WD40 repeat protein